MSLEKKSRLPLHSTVISGLINKVYCKKLKSVKVNCLNKYWQYSKKEEFLYKLLNITYNVVLF